MPSAFSIWFCNELYNDSSHYKRIRNQHFLKTEFKKNRFNSFDLLMTITISSGLNVSTHSNKQKQYSFII
jgi:hypothetical protein